MMKYCDEKIMSDKNVLRDSGNSDIISVAKYVPIIDLAERRISGNCNFSMAIDEMLLSFAHQNYKEYINRKYPARRFRSWS